MADENLISLQPGTVIAGRYEVVRCLGAGSMGLVYACRHRELTGHLVAVKVLFPEVAQDKVAAARFRNEIFASYGVSHPNVVRAYEYLRDGDLVAYTMEYVGGGALAERLDKSEGPIPVPEIIRLLAQMSLGVQAIHDAGIVHRDLKPENILLTKEGDVKIADFGIARTGHGPKLTEHGGVVGTIDYVSPEYMLNSQVDWRSDIYALGILGYEMLTGTSPFRGDSVYATMTKRLKSDPKPPSSLRPECPPALDKIVMRAMARDPEARYQSAEEIYRDLLPLMPDFKPASGAVRPSGAVRQQNNPRRASVPTTEGARRSATSSAPLEVERPWEPQRETSTVDFQLGQYAHSRAANPSVEGSDIRTLNARPQSRGSSSTVEWGAGDLRGGVNVAQSGIDSDRLQRLSRLADSTPSIWADLLVLALAAIIGVGVGLVVINIFFPEVLRQTGFISDSVMND